MKDAFPAIVLLLAFVGFVLGGCYLWIKIQVWKAGDRLAVNLEHDTLLFRKYREITKARHLPIWPLYLYWASLFVALILAMAAAATFHN